MAVTCPYCNQLYDHTADCPAVEDAYAWEFHPERRDAVDAVMYTYRQLAEVSAAERKATVLEAAKKRGSTLDPRRVYEVGRHLRETVDLMLGKSCCDKTCPFFHAYVDDRCRVVTFTTECGVWFDVNPEVFAVDEQRAFWAAVRVLEETVPAICKNPPGARFSEPPTATGPFSQAERQAMIAAALRDRERSLREDAELANAGKREIVLRTACGAEKIVKVHEGERRDHWIVPINFGIPAGACVDWSSARASVSSARAHKREFEWQGQRDKDGRHILVERYEDRDQEIADWRRERDKHMRESSEWQHKVGELQHAYEQACKTIADMHAAAIGEAAAPRRGVVEDVEDLRRERDRWRRAAEQGELIKLTDGNLAWRPATDQLVEVTRPDAHLSSDEWSARVRAGVQERERAAAERAPSVCVAIDDPEDV